MKLNPSKLHVLSNGLTAGTKITFGNFGVVSDDIDYDPINNELELNTYVKSVKNVKKGICVLLEVEKPMIIPMHDRKVAFKPTEDVEVFIYNNENEDEIQGYMAISAKSKILSNAVESLEILLRNYYSENGLSKQSNPHIQQLFFLIHENEEKIREEFGNFKQFYTEGMTHELVKYANLGGVNLEKSQDYKRYLDDYGGRLSAVVVTVNNTDIMITSEGRIWGTCHEFKKNKYELIAEVLKRLNDSGIIKMC
ncbi:hypothetical protein [Methanococcus sp. CF]